MMIIDTYPFINGKAVVWVKDSVFTEAEFNLQMQQNSD